MGKQVKIIFTSHALRKLEILKKHGLNIIKKEIKDTILTPNNLDTVSDEPNFIASKDYDDRHVLRVVYKIESGIIKVITFYPAEKGRYY